MKISTTIKPSNKKSNAKPDPFDEILKILTKISSEKDKQVNPFKTTVEPGINMSTLSTTQFTKKPVISSVKPFIQSMATTKVIKSWKIPSTTQWTTQLSTKSTESNTFNSTIPEITTESNIMHKNIFNDSGKIEQVKPNAPKISENFMELTALQITSFVCSVFTFLVVSIIICFVIYKKRKMSYNQLPNHWISMQDMRNIVDLYEEESFN